MATTIHCKVIHMHTCRHITCISTVHSHIQSYSQDLKDCCLILYLTKAPTNHCIFVATDHDRMKFNDLIVVATIFYTLVTEMCETVTDYMLTHVQVITIHHQAYQVTTMPLITTIFYYWD